MGSDGIIFLSRRYFISAGTQSSGLDVFTTRLGLNEGFPCLTSAFSLLVPPTCYSALIYYLYLSFPHLLVLWQSHHMEQQMEGSEQKAVCHLFGREDKNGLKMPQAPEAVSPTGSYPQLLEEYVCHSGHCEGGEALLPSTLQQLVKLKLINFNPKLALESVFRPGRQIQPHLTPDVEMQVCRQGSCRNSWGFTKATLQIAEPGGETEGSFLQPWLTPLACASVSLPLKQRQPWLTMSAIEEITTLTPLVDFRVAFPLPRMSPTTRYLYLAATQACFLPVPAAHTARRCWED